MTNILLIALLTVNVALLTFVGVYTLRFRSLFRSFVTSPDEKTPSPFAELVSNISDVFSRSVLAGAKTTFMGLQSGLVRGEKAVGADIAEDIISAKNPLLGAALDSFPSLRKTLRRNPKLIDIVAQRLLDKSTPAPAGSNHSDQFSFKLKV